MTFAERAATVYGKTSLIVDVRDHFGGNAYDRYDDHGVLIHPYGPHYFRTNSPKLVEYLSQFTEWQPVAYEIKSWVDGAFWNFPINLNTFEQFIGRSSSTSEMEAWLDAHRVPIDKPANSEEVIVSQVGWDLYRKFFEGYTLKQWKRHPRELEPSVCGRIPIRTNRDNRYLTESFQALPKAGYAKLFENMLQTCGDKVKLLLRTDYREVMTHVSHDHLVYTGPIDEFFEFRHGQLPYRSLKFESESFDAHDLRSREKITNKRGFWQPALQVNYPGPEPYTRIVEIKHATRQKCENTTIVREFPADYSAGSPPFYPVPTPDSTRRYEKYRAIAAARPHSSFIGRLATYRYYNMDQVIAMALTEADRVCRRASDYNGNASN